MPPADRTPSCVLDRSCRPIYNHRLTVAQIIQIDHASTFTRERNFVRRGFASESVALERPIATERPMPARSPGQLSQLYCRSFNARDLAGVVALYEEDALLMRHNHEIRGLAAIEAAFRETLATTTIESLTLIRATERQQDDLCLVVSIWAVERSGGGETTSLEATTLEVSRRQPNGDWKIVIDDPIVLNVR
jgi:ketosteroid isomerase-like protein